MRAAEGAPVKSARIALPISRSSDHKIGLLCAFLVGLSVLASYPVLNMGTNDDWSYTRTSLDLLRTGHLVYNGWATAMLGWQAYWGALFIKLFGFSFLVVRLSTLPLAMATAYLQYMIFRWFGVSRRNAVLGTLTVVLSPVFLPVAASFMTDVPGFFSILLGLYACLRAVDSKNARNTILWLLFATLVSIVGGTARQIVWLGGLLTVPSTAWLVRQRRGVLPAAAAMWISAFISVLACLYWYGQQPYALPEKFDQHLGWGVAQTALAQGRGTLLTILLMELPVLGAFLASFSKIPRKLSLSILAALIVFAAFRAHGGGYVSALAPWLPNMISEYGVLGSGVLENLGVKPVVLPVFVRLAVTVIVLAASATALAALASCRKLPSPQEHSPSWLFILTLLGPFSVGYLLLLLPRAAFLVTVDRYLIPLTAILLIPLLRYYQERIRFCIPNFSFGLLAVLAAYGIASTHDYFATNRARLRAAERIESTGVPRTAIQGGWEYDSWTQLQEVGYINDWRLENPRDAYRKPAPSSLPVPCRYWFAENTSVVKPRYFVVFSPMDCLAESHFPPVQYYTWLPPFMRQISIQQLPEAD